MSKSPPEIILKIVDAIRANQLANNYSLLPQALLEGVDNAEHLFQIGLSCANANRLDDAIIIFSYLQANSKNDIRIPYNSGIVFSMQGQHQKAIEAYDLALQINPNDGEALVNKGSACNDMGKHSLALQVLDHATQINPDMPEAWSNKGIALNHLKMYEDAVNAYDEAIKLKPNYFEALSNRSVPLNNLKQHTNAIKSCDLAIEINPNYIESWLNKGLSLSQLKRYQEAIACYDQAISLKPEYAEAWSNKGVSLYELKRYQEAIFHYDKAIGFKSNYAEAWSNKGVTLSELKRYEEAVACYDQAISLKPDYAEAWSNKGVSLQQLKFFNEAIAYYDRAISLQSDSVNSWMNRGIAFHELRRYEESIADYEKALSLKSDLDWVFGDLMYLKMKISSWDLFQENLNYLRNKIQLGEKIIAPFPLLALIDDPLLHQQCAQIYIQEKYPVNLALGPIAKRAKSSKIRVGYFSADFCNHPTAFLAAELFELHNRDRFEIIAFSFSPNDQSPMRSRLQSAFDEFIDITELSDEAAANHARDLKIDIAVDLGGHTKDARTGIFAYRAAPMQVNYLGYPGSLGASYMDYIIADKVLIPNQHKHVYEEKIVYLPDAYQINDRKRSISTRQFSRQELGLPETGFVFCCFNNNFKVLPEVFDSWMRILLAVEGSVLWLFEENVIAAENLKRQAVQKGISDSRLVFAARMASSEHLARHQYADLFLDTAPYNAHTTTSDALWAGLPVLTLPGQSFASRVAASLLNAIELPELIASSRDHYEALAIELASNPSKLAAIKEKLVNNRQTTPLFNTPLFTQNLEKAYTQIYERYQADLPPDHVVVG